MTESRYMSVAMHQVTDAYEKTLATLEEVLAYLEDDRFLDARRTILKNAEHAHILLEGLASCHPDKVREMARSKISEEEMIEYEKSLQTFVVLEQAMREDGSEHALYETIVWVRDTEALLLALARRTT